MSSSPDLSTSSLFNVKNKIVLITGGGSGIGYMIASGFATNGAKVYIAGRKEEQLKKAVSTLNKTSPFRVSYIPADISSKSGCNALISEFQKRGETRLDVLVNNSGVSWGGRYEDFPEKKGWDGVFDVNVKSVFYLTAGLTDLLSRESTARDPGRVINISSVASVEPAAEGSVLIGPGMGTWSYQASKAAVNQLTSTLAVRLLDRHVTVNAILPGVFPSKMTSYGFKTAEEVLLADQPTGRYGQPEDVAGLALFLASPASAHITGTHILLDGGARFMRVRIAPATKL